MTATTGNNNRNTMGLFKASFVRLLCVFFCFLCLLVMVKLLFDVFCDSVVIVVVVVVLLVVGGGGGDGVIVVCCFCYGAYMA